eukprot:gene4239-8433_t
MNPQRETLMDLIKNGDFLGFLQLSKKGQNVNVFDDDGWCPLIYAASHLSVQWVESILDRGGNINIQNSVNTTYISPKSSLELTLTFLKQYGSSALGGAAFFGKTEIIEYLLRRGADISIKSKNGYTSLMGAACCDHYEAVSLLIDFGAPINTANNSGHSALDRAVCRGYDNTVDVLLRNGANVDAQDNEGWTSVARGASYGHMSTVTLLLKHGASVNICTKEGKSPLHLALAAGKADLANLLVLHGADINLTDNEGKNAVDLCEKNHELRATLIETEPRDISPKKGLPTIWSAISVSNSFFNSNRNERVREYSNFFSHEEKEENNNENVENIDILDENPVVDIVVETENRVDDEENRAMKSISIPHPCCHNFKGIPRPAKRKMNRHNEISNFVNSGNSFGLRKFNLQWKLFTIDEFKTFKAIILTLGFIRYPSRDAVWGDTPMASSF